MGHLYPFIWIAPKSLTISTTKKLKCKILILKQQFFACDLLGQSGKNCWYEVKLWRIIRQIDLTFLDKYNKSTNTRMVVHGQLVEPAVCLSDLYDIFLSDIVRDIRQNLWTMIYRSQWPPNSMRSSTVSDWTSIQSMMRKWIIFSVGGWWRLG